MDYFDTLRRNSWLADPGERVRVVAIHREHCPAYSGRSCACDPRLVLAPYTRSRDVKLIDNDLPTLDVASGE